MSTFNTNDRELYFKLKNVVDEDGLGILLYDPDNFRSSGEELEIDNLTQSERCELLLKYTSLNNKDLKALTEDIVGENGVYVVGKNQMTVMPIAEYLKGIDNPGKIMKFYSCHTKFISVCNEILEAINNGDDDLSRFDNTYYVIVGGNTRASILFLKHRQDPYDKQSLNKRIRFSVVYLDDYFKRFPGTYVSNKGLTKQQLNEWKYECQEACDFLALRDNIFYGKNNFPERNYLAGLSGVVNNYFSYRYKEDRSVAQFISDNMPRFRYVGMRRSSIENLLMYSRIMECRDELALMQEPNSFLAQTGLFDVDSEQWFLQKVIEILRRINAKKLDKNDKANGLKEDFFNAIGFSIYSYKIVDLAKFNSFLNAIAEPLIFAKGKEGLTKAQLMVEPIWDTYVGTGSKFVQYVGDGLFEYIYRVLNEAPEVKNQSSIIKSQKKDIEHLYSIIASLREQIDERDSIIETLEASLNQIRTDAKKAAASVA